MRRLVTLIAVVVVAGVVGASEPGEAAFPGLNGKIAFESFRDGNWEIFAINPDGSGEMNLTNSLAHEHHPSWSSDGSQIAVHRTPDAFPGIYVMNADGTGATLRIPAGMSPSWSPDGTEIAYELLHLPNNTEIYLQNADGSGAATRCTDHESSDIFASWSPDGSTIAFQSTRLGPQFAIYVVDVAADCGSTPQAPTLLQSDAASANWSPDGSKIAFFRRFCDGLCFQQIFVMNADGTGVARIGDMTADEIYPSWSPDGSRLVFSSRVDGNWEIYVMNVNGSGRTRLTNNTATDLFPDWGPLDTDSDGMPDLFENAHPCLDPLVDDAAADPDGDGRTNLEEFQLGSKPCVANVVGGVAELPEVAGTPLETDGSSGGSAGVLVGVAAAAAGGAVALGGAAWYARRRVR